MDVVSHGLWGGLAFGRNRRRDYWLSFIFGVAPDILSFGILIIAQIFNFQAKTDWSSQPTNADIPSYVHILYNYTHSLVIFALVFFIVWWLLRRPFLPLLAWGFHIFLDIFTHSTEFFATPFLWPLSNFKINGISWSHPLIFFPNWIAIIIGYIIWYVYKKRKNTFKELKDKT